MTCGKPSDELGTLVRALQTETRRRFICACWRPDLVRPLLVHHTVSCTTIALSLPRADSLTVRRSSWNTCRRPRVLPARGVPFELCHRSILCSASGGSLRSFGLLPSPPHRACACPAAALSFFVLTAEMHRVVSAQPLLLHFVYKNTRCAFILKFCFFWKSQEISPSFAAAVVCAVQRWTLKLGVPLGVTNVLDLYTVPG